MSTHNDRRVEVASGLIGMALATKLGADALIEYGAPWEFPRELRPVADAIFELHRVGQEPSISTVLAELGRHGQASYTAEYLSGLASALSVNASFCRSEVQRMRDFEAADLLSTTSANVAARLAGDGLADGVLDELRQELLAAVDASATSTAETAIETFDAGQEALRSMDLAAARKPIPMLPHGIPELRGLVPGLKPGRVYLVGGRTSSGKSLLAMEMTRHACSHEVAHLGRRPRAVVASLEMSPEDLYRRMLAAELCTPESWFDRPGDCFTAERWSEIRERIQDRSKGPQMLIAGSQGKPGRKVRTMAQIESLCRIEHRRGNCDLVVIDHIGLVEGPQREIRLRIIDTATRVQSLAADLQVPVILVAQLNREGAKGNERPYLMQIAESSAVEQAADTAILLHRPNRQMSRDEKQAEASRDGWEYQPGIEPLELIVAKNRGGSTGEAAIAVDLPCYRLGDDEGHLSQTRERAAGAGSRMGRCPLPEESSAHQHRVVPPIADLPKEPVQ